MRRHPRYCWWMLKRQVALGLMIGLTPAQIAFEVFAETKAVRAAAQRLAEERDIHPTGHWLQFLTIRLLFDAKQTIACI